MRYKAIKQLVSSMLFGDLLRHHRVKYGKKGQSLPERRPKSMHLKRHPYANDACLVCVELD